MTNRLLRSARSTCFRVVSARALAGSGTALSTAAAAARSASRLAQGRGKSKRAILVMSRPVCRATRSEVSCSSTAIAVPRTYAFSSSAGQEGGGAGGAAASAAAGGGLAGWRRRERSRLVRSPGTFDHSLLPTVLRQELPTAFLATTIASSRDSCARNRRRAGG